MAYTVSVRRTINEIEHRTDPGYSTEEPDSAKLMLMAAIAAARDPVNKPPDGDR